MKQFSRKAASLLLSVSLLCGLAVPTAGAAENRYSDTKGHWAESAIARWSDYGIVTGYDGRFAPDESLTRAQMATVLTNTLGLTETAANPFTDVKENDWFAPYVLRCYAAGMMAGDQGRANPNASITREQAMVMLCRALEIAPENEQDLSDYADRGAVSAWAAPYVAAMVHSGMVSGISADRVGPSSPLTRAALLTILDRAIAVYANQDGATVNAAKADGLILVVAKNVTVQNVPQGTQVLVCKGADGAKVNGKAVPAGTVYSVDTGTAAKPSSGGGSSGGSNSTAANLTVTRPGTVETGGTYASAVITEGVADGEVILSGLTIRGDLTIQGGGSRSVKLVDCTVGGKIILDKAAGQPPRLYLTNTPVAAVDVCKPAILEAADTASQIGSVTARSDTTVQGANTTVETLAVAASAAEPVALSVTDATVQTVTAEQQTEISGTGTVETVVAAAPMKLNSDTVSQIEIPSGASGVRLDISGGNQVEVTVNTEHGAEITGVAVEVSTALEIPPEVTVNAATCPHIHRWGPWRADASGETHTSQCMLDSTHLKTAFHHWDDGVVTTAPTATAEGAKTYTCTVCAATKTEAIPSGGGGDQATLLDRAEHAGLLTYFSGTDLGEATRLDMAKLIVAYLDRTVTNVSAAQSAFSDCGGLTDRERGVIKAVCADGTMQAASKGIFLPDGIITRGQAAVVLSHAMGDPQIPWSKEFSDLGADPRTKNMVNNLYNLGVLTGVTEKTFDSEAVATKADILTWLLNAKGENGDRQSYDVIFVVGNPNAKLYKSGSTEYFVYDAVVNGEITSVKVKANSAAQRAMAAIANTDGNENVGIFFGMAKNSGGYVTQLTTAVPQGVAVNGVAQEGANTGNIPEYIGTRPDSNGFTFNTAGTSVSLPADDKATIVYYDGDDLDNVSKLSTDPDDRACVVTDNGQVVAVLVRAFEGNRLAYGLVNRMVCVVGNPNGKLNKTGSTEYYVYDAVVRGEVTTIKVKNNSSAQAVLSTLGRDERGNEAMGVFFGLTKNSNGYVTELTTALPGGVQVNGISTLGTAVTTDTVAEYVGTRREADGALRFNTAGNPVSLAAGSGALVMYYDGDALCIVTRVNTDGDDRALVLTQNGCAVAILVREFEGEKLSHS